jgi:hypothetical protein
MAKLIVVNSTQLKKEILLNADHIEYISRRDLPRGSITEIRMMNGNIHHVTELPDQVLGLSR